MLDGLRSQLDELLEEDPLSVRKREVQAFDDLVKPHGSSLVLFGAGNLGRKALARLREDGLEPVAFSDNNPALWDKSIDGLQVLSPEVVAARFAQQAAFVVTIWRPGIGHRFADTQRQLRDLGCRKVVSFVSLFWKYPETFLPACCFDLPHKISANAEAVRGAFALWADNESRSTYVTQLKWRMQPDFDELPLAVAKEQYFPDNLFGLTADDLFVDCGAFDGDTVRSYLRHRKDSFRGIVAIEPDPANFQRLQAFVGTLPSPVQAKIRLLQLAVGEREEKVGFSATGTVSSIVTTESELQVRSMPLDAILSDLRPTYIKMDIEGSELAALAGARALISQDHPILAICVYYRQDHLWRVPLFVESIRSDYRFFLRPHDEEGWDLVCYAVPAETVYSY
jgi:FkbM family methyltransferase